MTSVSDSNGSTLFSATYTRDNSAQLSSDSSQNSNQANYKYTPLNQLCYAGSGTGNACSSPPASSYPYAFDAADNLTANNGTAQQYNNADELCWSVSGTSSNNCATTPTGATTYGYDNKGNRTSTVPSTGSATCDTFDQPNRLTKIQTGTGSGCTTPTTVGTYAYDGDGMRESKTVSGTTTQFTWDGGGNLLQQYDGTTKTSFIYGPGGLPVEQIAGSTTTYLHHDQLGSTRLITDSAGSTSTATTDTYGPYGNVVSSSGSLTTPLMFCGQYKDSESSLYYLRARYYDPTTAQFLTLDPAVGTTLSPYAYILGSPLNGVDPSGMDVWCSALDRMTDASSCTPTPPASELGKVKVGTVECNGSPSDGSTVCYQSTPVDNGTRLEWVMVKNESVGSALGGMVGIPTGGSGTPSSMPNADTMSELLNRLNDMTAGILWDPAAVSGNPGSAVPSQDDSALAKALWFLQIPGNLQDAVRNKCETGG